MPRSLAGAPARRARIWNDRLQMVVHFDSGKFSDLGPVAQVIADSQKELMQCFLKWFAKLRTWRQQRKVSNSPRRTVKCASCLHNFAEGSLNCEVMLDGKEGKIVNVHLISRCTTAAKSNQYSHTVHFFWPLLCVFFTGKMISVAAGLLWVYGLVNRCSWAYMGTVPG